MKHAEDYILKIKETKIQILISFISESELLISLKWGAGGNNNIITDMYQKR